MVTRLLGLGLYDNNLHHILIREQRNVR
jgi:hypothetical protein